MNRNTKAPACFAPPLTDETIESYRSMINEVEDAALRDVLSQMLACVDAWWDEDYSDAAGTTTPNGVRLVPLTPRLVEALDATTPWPHEVDAMQTFIDARADSMHVDLRNAAYHLLWHCRELTIDREPATQDRVRS